MVDLDRPIGLPQEGIVRFNVVFVPHGHALAQKDDGDKCNQHRPEQ